MCKVKTSAWVLWAKKDDIVYNIVIQNEEDRSIEFDFNSKHYEINHPSYAPDILKRDFSDYEFGYDEKFFEFEV